MNVSTLSTIDTHLLTGANRDRPQVALAQRIAGDSLDAAAGKLLHRITNRHPIDAR
jgi:hypothetical protein